MVIFHKLHLPVLGSGLELQRLDFSMGDVIERLDRILPHSIPKRSNEREP